jgi:hypothetical protein
MRGDGVGVGDVGEVHGRSWGQRHSQDWLDCRFALDQRDAGMVFGRSELV